MILFLDFDGVLHPMDRRDGCFSCLSAFEAVLREFTDVEIVISSSWRIDYSLMQLRAMFSPDIAVRVIDVTPDRAVMMESIEPYRREREIEDWLRQNGREHEPWLVLDDCEWMFSQDCTRLLLVDPRTGFDNRAAAILRSSLRRNSQPQHETHDLLYTHKGETTPIPVVTTDFCPACGEPITDIAESGCVMREMQVFNKQVNAALVDPTTMAAGGSINP